jgi:DNA ligase-1
VVGAFAGRGRRRGVYGAVLLAAYDPDADVFRTVGKCGTGFSDAELAVLPARLAPYRLDHKAALVDARQPADVWFEPGVVLEVLSAELTLSPNATAGWGQLKENSGLAMRFPRFTGRWRDDKTPAGLDHHDRARPALPAGPAPGVTVENRWCERRTRPCRPR